MSDARILVVDDDADLVDAVSTVLESSGYAVDSAANGQEARDRIREARPDLIILDVMMDTVGEGLQLALEFAGLAVVERHLALVLKSQRQAVGG